MHQKKLLNFVKIQKMLKLKTDKCSILKLTTIIFMFIYISDMQRWGGGGEEKAEKH